MEERHTDLEVRLAQMEDLLDALNLTVYRQQEAITLLQRQLQTLGARVNDLGQLERRAPDDELPPHY